MITTLLLKERRALKANLDLFYTPGKHAFSPTRFATFCNSNGMQRVLECFQQSRQSKPGIHFQALLSNRTCLYCKSHIASLPAQVCRFCLKTEDGRYFAYSQGLVKMRQTKNDPTRQFEKKQRTLERTGYAHHMQNPEFLTTYRQNLLATTGYENPSFNPEVVEKRRQTSLDRRGVTNPLQDPKVQRKVRKTLKATRGVTNPMQDPEVKAKCKSTWETKYEGGHPLRDSKVRSQVTNTLTLRYGVNNPGQVETGKVKSTLTCLSKYGAPNPSQAPVVKRKIRQTNLRKYGYTHPNKNPEHFATVKHYRQREYLTSDGRLLQLMGYEPEAFQVLAKVYGAENVRSHKEHPVSLPYVFDRKPRQFHPDFSVGNLNFEIKSAYTLIADLRRNRAKSKYNPEVRFLVIWKTKNSFEYLLLPKNWHLLTKAALKKRLLRRRTF